MSSEVIEAPDVLAITMDYVRPLINVPCASNVPNPRPASFLRFSVNPSGGFDGRVLYNALLTVEAWAQSERDAGDLARRAAALLDAAQGFFATSGGPGWFPDPDSGLPRYLFTVAVIVRGSVI
jgi:hypothetical protein